jgi:hypothetical protein
MADITAPKPMAAAAEEAGGWSALLAGSTENRKDKATTGTGNVLPENCRYVLKTPNNPGYAGITYGLKFTGGEAETLDRELAWTISTDFVGYEVEAYELAAAPPPPPVRRPRVVANAASQ